MPARPPLTSIPDKTAAHLNSRDEPAFLAQPPLGQYRDAQPLSHVVDGQQLHHVAVSHYAALPVAETSAVPSLVLRRASSSAVRHRARSAITCSSRRSKGR